MTFVLDNSVVTGWYLPDQATAFTARVAARLGEDRAIVPPIWALEAANVLRTACIRGKLAPEAARQVTDLLAVLPIEIEEGSAPGARRLFELALRHGVSSYDAAYLELAMRHGIPLATQDVALANAARTAGVALL